MNDKYYTPDISEFHVGFEFARISNGKFIPDEIEALSDFEEIVEYDIKGYNRESNIYNMGNLRVKYLNAADIESLGFKQHISYQWSFYNEKEEADLIWMTRKGIPYVSIHTSKKSVTNADIAFTGYIKNKSELKVLLKQLNITINE